MILHRYFARRFARAILAILALFFAMLALIDLIDQARRYGDAVSGFGELVALTLLAVPEALYGILPLVVIIATLALFLGLARSSELVVTRAAGRSAVRALWAPVLVALAFGIIAVALFNPLVAATSKAYEARLNDLTDGGRVLALSEDGVWLRQGNGREQTVIRATGASLDGTRLTGVTFMTFGSDGRPTRRIEAAAARLTPGAWSLTDAKQWPLDGAENAENAATTQATLRVASTLTAQEIRDSFGTPASIPIWELPQFIERLRAAGFSARRHEVFLQMELAMPVFLVAMVMIGAGFTMRHQRGGRTGVMVLAAVLLSFGLYFLRNFAQILGETGQIPALLAAWAPPLAAIGLSLAFILHLEDG